jgi:colanic acid biosynthesis glycosyl transferase WcaI
MAKRIWIISELYYPEETSTGYFLTKIAEGLAKYYPVKVLCSQPTYLARGLRAPSRERRNGVTVQRCPSTTLNKNMVVGKLINVVTISFSILFASLFKIKKGDSVIVVTNPPLLPFLVMIACKLRKAKFLLLVHDVYPEVLFASKIIDPSSVLVRFLEWSTKLLYLEAERIIVLGRDMKDLVCRKASKLMNRMDIIPNWADLDQIFPNEGARDTFLKEFGLSGKFVIQYSGNIGRTHGFGCILESASRLAELQDIQFLFIGWGAKEPGLKRSVREKKLKNVKFLPPQPRGSLCRSLNSCDVALISLIEGMAGVSVPSRMYNILAAGKPIIAVVDEDSEVGRVVREEKVGWVIPPAQGDRITEVILEARANPDLLARMGIRAREAAESKYSFRHIIEKYRNLIDILDNDSNKQA